MVNRASESKQPRQCHCWTRGPVAVPTPYSKAWQNMTELTEHWHVFESCNLGLYRSTCYTRAVLSLIHELFTGFWWIQHIHQPSLNRYRTCDVNAYLRAELPKASTLHTLDMRLQFFTNPMKELSRVYDVYALFMHCLCIVYAFNSLPLPVCPVWSSSEGFGWRRLQSWLPLLASGGRDSWQTCILENTRLNQCPFHQIGWIWPD